MHPTFKDIIIAKAGSKGSESINAEEAVIIAASNYSRSRFTDEGVSRPFVKECLRHIVRELTGRSYRSICTGAIRCIQTHYIKRGT